MTRQPIFDFRRLLPIAAWFLAASIVFGLIAWTQINRAERNIRAQIARERATVIERVR